MEKVPNVNERRRIPMRAIRAVDIRYPSEVTTKDEARSAVKSLRTVRAFMRQRLGLP